MDNSSRIDPYIPISTDSVNFTLSGNVVDIINRKIFKGEISFKGGIIESISEKELVPDIYIIPAFVDAHVHIESSMLTPSEFARLAMNHGVIASVSDPHEIANVMGIDGVRYMMEQAEGCPFRFYFGAPSCVPATKLESSGAEISTQDIEYLMGLEEIHYLSEMMNYPGVIKGDGEVLAKIASARKHGKPVDGHAPGLTGYDLGRYIQAGISTDHETTMYSEGKEKLQGGMKLLIREGSAAKNLEELGPLVGEFPDACMLCSDDKHPDDLLRGYINTMVKALLLKGFNLFEVLRCASFNAAQHYKIDMGFLQPGDRADFIVLDNLSDFNILSVFIEGRVVCVKGECMIDGQGVDIVNKFNAVKRSPDDFVIKAEKGLIRVIEVYDGQIITGQSIKEAKIVDGRVVSDTDRDILKIVVVNRYIDAPAALGFVKNFGLKRGAIASSVAHDSHNLVAVGVEDLDIAKAINQVIIHKGGLALCDGDWVDILPLPIAGLMSNKGGAYTAEAYSRLDRGAKQLGSTLTAPFMTLSFMSLLVIPELKIGDKGLFNGLSFDYVPLYVLKDD